MRRISFLAIAVLALAVACTGDDAGPSAGADDATLDPAATADDSVGAGSDTPSTGDAATAPATNYIDAGGSGVAIRSDCSDKARAGGSVPDGTSVRVVQDGDGDCAGWSLVFAGVGSWVREEYLSDVAPAGAQVAAPSGNGTAVTRPAPTATTTSPPPPASTPASTPAPLVLSLPDGSKVTLDSIVGQAKILGGENGFVPLGLVTGNRSHPDSVCNPTGRFGSPGSDISIHNSNSIYGSPPGGAITSPTFNSRYSAYNSSADDPPRIVLNDNLIAWVSTSPLHTPRIHPDTLFFHLNCVW